MALKLQEVSSNQANKKKKIESIFPLKVAVPILCFIEKLFILIKVPILKDFIAISIWRG